MGVPKETLDRGLYWRNQAFITEFYHPLSRKQRLRQNPNERVYTFWDYMRNAYGRNAGLRLDHFLLNPKVADGLVNAGVDKQVRGWDKASDHAPVWIELAD
jgi:exonuclease III